MFPKGYEPKCVKPKWDVDQPAVTDLPATFEHRSVIFFLFGGVLGVISSRGKSCSRAIRGVRGRAIHRLERRRIRDHNFLCNIICFGWELSTKLSRRENYFRVWASKVIANTSEAWIDDAVDSAVFCLPSISSPRSGAIYFTRNGTQSLFLPRTPQLDRRKHREVPWTRWNPGKYLRCYF